MSIGNEEIRKHAVVGDRVQWVPSSRWPGLLASACGGTVTKVGSRWITILWDDGRTGETRQLSTRGWRFEPDSSEAVEHATGNDSSAEG
jgi:hypothetical protein